MQGTIIPGARRRGRPRTAWMDNIKTWTGLSVEESIRMAEDRDKWRKYVHGMANPRIEDGWRTEQNRTGLEGIALRRVGGWKESGDQRQRKAKHSQRGKARSLLENASARTRIDTHARTHRRTDGQAKNILPSDPSTGWAGARAETERWQDVGECFSIARQWFRIVSSCTNEVKIRD